MNNIQSAVSDVALSGSAPRARRAPVSSAPATPPVASEAKPGRGRGRQPVFLKGGKPLSEARLEAKAAVATAKQGLKDAKAARAEALKNDKLASKAVEAATKEHVRVQTKPLPNKPEQKVALTNAKAALKSAESTSKAAHKAVDVAEKAVVKADAAVHKAEDARLKVEAAKLATKAPVAPTVN